MKKHLYNVKIDALSKRIDELSEDLENCTDPCLRWNLQDSIAKLVETQSEICKEFEHKSRGKRVN